jgi:glycosyltransferase involved in cell wall biosynthesis
MLPWLWRKAPNTGGTVFYDVSHFVDGPRRTGIQRVTFEILKSWTGKPPLAPGFIEPRSGRAVLLPGSFMELTRQYFSGTDQSSGALAERIKALSRRRWQRALEPQELEGFAGFLNAEVFREPERIAFYDRLADRLPERVHWIVYDALVWLHPEYFPPGAADHASEYLRLLRRIPNLHFISPETKRDFCQRLLRAERASYSVCPPGSDSLGRAKPARSCSTRRFTCLGTIEPRKRHRIVLDAFDALWARGIDAELCFVGNLGWDPSAEGWLPNKIGTELERRAADDPRFTWYRELSDAAARDIITSSRATIYASDAEGYGIPPLESLALGIPVVAATALPSLKMIPDLGQLRLGVVSATTIAAAVAQLLDNDFAAQKRTEICDLDLPTWAGMAASLRDAMLPISG